MGNNHCNVDSNTVKWAQSFFIVRFMDQVYPLAGKLHFSLEVSRRICLIIAALFFLLPSLACADGYGPNILPAGSFDNATSTYIPWAGIDDDGNIHGIEGKQLAVGDDGSINDHLFGPSVAVGDLNGDGKPDLVLADSRGFFWFYPNSGTATKPAFTQGEVMPIWLGEERTGWSTEGADNVVPRIQLVDFDGNKRLDILAGTYSGKLFHVRNIGSATQPSFKPTINRDAMLINTHKRGVLWCNYLAPCLTTLFGSPNVLNLIMGEGTYSANSLYLLKNTNSSATPSFDEDHLQKIIPGMGLEQLTPVVVDWNNDGKPDILCGDRTGYLNLYLNTSTDPDHPTFATGTHVTVGGEEQLGGSITVTVCDLTGNHLPNLLIGNDDGTIVYATNTGKLGAPAFTAPPAPIKGVLPPNYHYTTPSDWSQVQAWGAPYELLSCVNPQLEPGFTFPEGEKTRYAFKFSVWPYKSVYFPERYYPPVEDAWREHVIACAQVLTLKLNQRYRVHFWIKANGNVADLRYQLAEQVQVRDGFQGYDVINPVSAGTGWTEVSSEVRIDNPDDKTVTTWRYAFQFRFTGQTTFYIDDLQVQEESD
jgi:FG-GAP-like repeat